MVSKDRFEEFSKEGCARVVA